MRTYLAACCVVLMWGTGAAAQSTPTPAVPAVMTTAGGGYETRLAELEQEIADLKFQVAGEGAIQPVSFSSDCGCGGGSCGGGCCRSCCECPGLYGGYSFVFAKPHFKEAFQASVIDGVTGQLQLLPFQYDYDLTPRVWLGYYNPCGIGARASYWSYDHDGDPRSITATPTSVASAHALTVIFPATITAAVPGDVLTTTDELSTQTLDLEGTLPGHFGKVTVLMSGGVRYVRLEQNLASTVSTGGNPTQFLNWGRKFEGLGPTMGAEFHYQLGCSNWSLFGSGRGALLYGDKDLDRFTNVTSAQTPTPYASLHDADEVVGMGEVQLGAEWTLRTARGWNLLMRGTYEGSLWAEAGAPTLGFLGFEGFALTLGIER